MSVLVSVLFRLSFPYLHTNLANCIFREGIVCGDNITLSGIIACTDIISYFSMNLRTGFLELSFHTSLLEKCHRMDKFEHTFTPHLPLSNVNLFRFGSNTR